LSTDSKLAEDAVRKKKKLKKKKEREKGKRRNQFGGIRPCEKRERKKDPVRSQERNKNSRDLFK